MARIAETMQERGHQVDFVYAPINTLVNYKFKNLNVTTLIFPNIHETTKLLTETSMYGDVFQGYHNVLGKDTVKTVGGLLRIYCYELINHPQMQIIARQRYDGLFTEALDACAMGVGHLNNIRPTFVLSPLPMYEAPSYSLGIPYNPNVLPVMNMAPPSGIHMNFMERIRNLYYYYDSAITSRTKLADYLFELVADKNLPPPEDLVRNAALFIQNTNEFVDLPKVLSSKQVLVGGIGNGKVKKLESPIQDIIDLSQEGIVYFSFGSLADNTKMPQNVRKAFVDAFAEFPEYQFIWKFDDILMYNVSNVHTFSWVDQVSILNHPKTKAFITHCGLNSLNEAAFAGVPMLSIPLFGDQTFNTAVVKHIGVGVALSKLGLTKESIVEALREVLYDKKIHEKSTNLKKILHSVTSPKDRLIQAVEMATEFPEVYENLKLPTAGLSLITYFSIDLIIYSVLITLTSILTIYFSYQIVFYQLFSKFFVNKVKMN
ncbi:unnamed protein product [Bursaphelenchus xylophilus]|uniref:UDP-glucuronosyltransferase n=1 Tax=Bursaphelenchus xylophilus TaxID=6326 RepID=A0A1I7SET3_BURXY|nr:unnamed protein product [Bursaphelenchus xylophilus]CAG9118754.1 unnamed protein product [Bursaphelenchus xylophilus]